MLQVILRHILHSSMTRIMSLSVDEKRQDLELLLQTNSINYNVIEHPAVFTVDEMMPHVKDIRAALCKNLFLKDKKKNLYLLSCVYDAEVKLNEIAKAVGPPGGLRFADESILQETLGVNQGSVTALSLHIDTGNKVRFLCDQRLLDDTYEAVSFHPMVNTATMCLSAGDFNKYLKLAAHEPTPVVFTIGA